MEKIHVLLDSQGLKKNIVLRTYTHKRLSSLRILGNINNLFRNIHLYGSLAGSLFSHKAVQWSCFAGAIMTQEAEYLIFEQIQVHVVDRREGTIWLRHI